MKALPAIAEKLAKERGAVFVDIFTPLSARGAGEPPLTEDGMHFTPAGQRIVADLIAQRLGLSVQLGRQRKSRSARRSSARTASGSIVGGR